LFIESKEGKNIMADGDILYLAFKTWNCHGWKIKYTVFRRAEEIRHPLDRKNCWEKICILGNIQINDHTQFLYGKKSLSASYGILKRDLVQPYSKEKMGGCGREIK